MRVAIVVVGVLLCAGASGLTWRLEKRRRQFYQLLIRHKSEVDTLLWGVLVDVPLPRRTELEAIVRGVYQGQVREIVELFPLSSLERVWPFSDSSRPPSPPSGGE